MKKVTQLEHMDRNAEMVIMRHRALFAKPGQLKEMIKLPCKRTQKVTVAMAAVEAILEVPFERVRDIMSTLHESITTTTSATTDAAFKQL